MNNSVSIKPSETGSLINVYQSNPSFGYITLQSSEVTTENGWIREKTRTALLRAEVPMLEKFLAVYGKSGNIPGRIVVREFVESALPENFKARLNKNLDYETAIEPFIKRAGKDGPPLTCMGERILRFTDYEASSKAEDIRVQHDNMDAIREFRAEQAAAGANLPK